MKQDSLTKLEEQEVAEVLEQFGLSEKDREVYFALLKLGKSSITPVARKVRFPATTVQSVLSRLEKTGLLNVGAHKSRRLYEAKDPLVFKKILERQAQEVGAVIPLLRKMKGQEKTGSRIHIYFREQMKDIFHEALKTENKIIYEIVSAKDLQDVLGEKFHFTKRRLENGIRLKSLRVEKGEIKKYNKRIHERESREAKFLPRELDFKISIMFWDDKVAFFTTREEGLAWIAESEALSEAMKQIFDLFWSISRKMETLEEV